MPYRIGTLPVVAGKPVAELYTGVLPLLPRDLPGRTLHGRGDQLHVFAGGALLITDLDEL